MLKEAMTLRDLTDPSEGTHAIQLVIALLENALSRTWHLPVLRDPGPRIVSITSNYDRLRYSPDAVTRDRRYSRYIDATRMLRSHTTARIPTVLDRLAAAPAPDEIVLSVPGICYRRDAIDRHHVGEPHQMDLWRVRRSGPPLGEDDLEAMVGLAVEAVLPGAIWRTVASQHPYTVAGREIYVETGNGAVEVGECGLAHPEVLTGSGLARTASGLAMGVGLDRLTMLAKGVDDIRLLRSTDPRVSAQMADLRPYQPVSAMPPVRRDLSLAVNEGIDAELLGDRVREVLGPAASAVEEVSVLSSTSYQDLPDSVRRRLGLSEGQKNLLVRVVLRDLDRTLTAAEANMLRDRIYAGLHEGSAYEWAGR